MQPPRCPTLGSSGCTVVLLALPRPHYGAHLLPNSLQARRRAAWGRRRGRGKAPQGLRSGALVVTEGASIVLWA